MNFPVSSAPVKSRCSTTRAPAISDRSPRIPTSTKAGVGPQRRPDAPAAGSGRVRILLDQLADRQPHRLLRLRPHRGDPGRVDQAERGHLGRDPVEGVARPPGGLLLLGPVAEGAAGERPVLVEEAVDQRLDHHRPVTRPQPLLRPFHHQVHRERIHPVDPPGRYPEADTAAGQPRLAGRLGHRGRDRVEVVLDEEAERQAPGRREVEALEHRPDVRRPVAEVRHGDIRRPRMKLRPGVARRHRHAAADDGVGAERPGLEPLQVHGAAAPGAVPLPEPENLGQRALQHLLHLGGDQALEVKRALGHVGEGLGQELVMPAMRPVDRVARAQPDDRADRAALLADAGVRRAVHEPRPGQLEDRLLERADEMQLPQHRRQQPRVGRLPVRRSRAQLVPLDPGRNPLHTWHRHLPPQATPPRYPSNASISTHQRPIASESQRPCPQALDTFAL